MIQDKSCRICNSRLEVEGKCKFCNEPVRLFCHTCGVVTEKMMHPACMIIDVNTMLIDAKMHKNQ